MTSITPKKLEYKVLEGLLFSDSYMRKVFPFIKSEYFESRSERIVFDEICKFINAYDSSPSLDALEIEVDKRTDLSNSDYEDSLRLISQIEPGDINETWLLDRTERWCKERSIYLALTESIRIYDGKNDKLSVDAIPEILSNALAVGFDNHIGHDYFDQAEDRYDSYHQKESKIPFDLELLNLITKGGLSKRTLNILLAGTGVGKTLVMCHMASSFILQGYNVLYITLEMSEIKISERIDANLMNVNVSDIEKMSKDQFNSKIQNIQKKTVGKLVIKEYPTASANSSHFKVLLNELRLKKEFVPDVIFVDYLNICSSSRYRGGNVNSYTLIKSIAEELRGLAVEYDVPLISATQTTRSGYNSPEPELTDTSESFGLPATADFMVALISTEELEELGQLMIKQLKNRYNDPSYYKKFVVGIDRGKMKLFDVSKSAQTGIVEIKTSSSELPIKTTNKFEGFSL